MRSLSRPPTHRPTTPQRRSPACRRSSGTAPPGRAARCALWRPSEGIRDGSRPAGSTTRSCTRAPNGPLGCCPASRTPRCAERYPSPERRLARRTSQAPQRGPEPRGTDQSSSGPASHHAIACAAQYAGAKSGPRSSAVLATTSASKALAVTTETSSRPVFAGSPVRGSIR